jgi:hypothetical protein
VLNLEYTYNNKFEKKIVEVWKMKLFGTIIFSILFLNLFAQESSNSADFVSKKAIERSNELVLEYSKGYHNNVSRLVGNVWLSSVKKSNIAVYNDYIKELKKDSLKPKVMHCTIYAEACLKAGFSSSDFKKLKMYHKEIWDNKGFAGWSVAHLLTEKFGWKAYAFIRKGAKDYNHYLHFFKNKKEYPVWKQPNIKIEKFFILGKDDLEIKNLLSKFEFGWGFSKDGIHTWITNYTDLKECHWDGPPAKKYNPNNYLPFLYETTPFLEFYDYNIHLLVFPPKR